MQAINREGTANTEGFFIPSPPLLMGNVACSHWVFEMGWCRIEDKEFLMISPISFDSCMAMDNGEVWKRCRTLQASRQWRKSKSLAWVEDNRRSDWWSEESWSLALAHKERMKFLPVGWAIAPPRKGMPVSRLKGVMSIRCRGWVGEMVASKGRREMSTPGPQRWHLWRLKDRPIVLKSGMRRSKGAIMVLPSPTSMPSPK